MAEEGSGDVAAPVPFEQHIREIFDHCVEGVASPKMNDAAAFMAMLRAIGEVLLEVREDLGDLLRLTHESVLNAPKEK